MAKKRMIITEDAPKLSKAARLRQAVADAPKEAPIALRHPAPGTAYEYLQHKVEEKSQETIELGGVAVNKILLALGDGDELVLLRRQFVMEWLLGARVHPECGKMTPHGIARRFDTSVGVVKRDIEKINAGLCDVFRNQETFETEILGMVGRTLGRAEENVMLARQTLHKVDTAISFLEKTYGDLLHTHESKTAAMPKKQIPQHLQPVFNSVSSMTLAAARMQYEKLLKLRSSSVDTIIKATADANRLIKDLLNNSGGGRQGGGDDGGGSTGVIGSVVVNQDQRQIHNTYQQSIVSREELIEMSRSQEFGVQLPMGLGRDALEKERQHAEKLEADEKYGTKQA